MKRVLSWAGTGLLFGLVALSLSGALLPPLLDRTYYTGPVSDHFDGTRFFNPGGDEHRRSFATMARFFSGRGRTPWPERVSVTPSYPHAAVTPCPPMRGAVVENWKRCVDTVDPRAMVATWIGHATVLVQAGDVNVLTDPIWSDRASPVPWAGPKRVRAPGIRLEDLPRIDVVVVSHNHYDHMDVPTLKALWDRDRPVIVTSLGNDTILRNAGISGRYDGLVHCGRCPGVESLDWGDASLASADFDPHETHPEHPRRSPVGVVVERNHHWGSRWGADRNRALWSAFRIETPAGAIFFAGDTGYGDGSWAREAAAGGAVRLAILPIGGYEPREAMKDHHMNPAEAVRVFDTLRPAMGLGVHWGTFPLTFEGIDVPPRELARVRGRRNFVASEVGRPMLMPEVARIE